MIQKEQTINGFNNLGIGEKILSILTKEGFDTPTPIQHQVISSALEGKDIVGIAQTGTGKTLAFGIPMIQRLALNKGQGLILVPTRELAFQVEQSLKQIGTPLGLQCVVIIGGTPQQAQVRDLKRNPHIVIATPGRLVDLMNQGAYKLDRVNIVTLDEADRMLDVGFLPQIKKILQTVTKDRQTMLFSATMPQAISSLASAFMKIPLRIEIAPQGTSAKNVEQELFIVGKNFKIRLLDSLLQQYHEDTVLIFSRTKHGSKRLARDIQNMGHTVTEIHGNRSLSQRKAALDGFKNGKYRVMVATDIAARGIDVKGISLVINYDLPDNSEDYVHRIGRTGRAGRFGKAISFATSAETADIKKIERLIRKTLPVLSLPTLPPERPKPLHQEQERVFRPRYSGQQGGSRRGFAKQGERKDSDHSGSRPFSGNKRPAFKGSRQNNFRRPRRAE